MKKTYLIVFTIAALMSFLPSGESIATDYHPCKKGVTKEYTVHLQFSSGRTQDDSFFTKELGQQIVDGKKVFILKNDRGKTFYILKDNSGVCEYAVQDKNDIEPKVTNPPECVIKYPIKKGTTWSEKGVVPFYQKYIGKIDVTFTIESVHDTVTVQAGTFKNCLKIRSSGEKDGFSTQRYYWYAPDVGLIKHMTESRSPFSKEPNKMNYELSRISKE